MQSVKVVNDPFNENYIGTLNTRELNKKLNDILRNIDNNKVENFQVEKDYYIVTYSNGQIWKFKNYGLLNYLEVEFQILLNKFKNKISKHKLF